MANKKKPISPSTPPVETAQEPKPGNVVCPEHGIQQVIGLSVCPICGETPTGK